MSTAADAITDKKAYELFGRGIPPQSTRQKLLFTALDLFYTHGIHAVGLDRILAEVGVTKTTFYNHFPSKDDLILECIATRDAWESRWFEEEVEKRGGGDSRAMLLAVFDVLDTWFCGEQFNGCAFLNAAIEFPSPNDPIHRAAAAHMDNSEKWLAELATQAGASEPQRVAEEFSVLIQGSMVTRHAMNRDEAAAVSRRMAEAVLDRYLPPRPRK
ncbi:MAG: TetR/AcrR family transcriptional regulator [Planctomycetota bacterium]